ncbi:hypothetical protein HYH02_010855 [Chlamydomonas schloesseri]|uniref:Uncharacterized protein n=1 Tax=Chlamydomonas schloesseri TaxID=2026947 RepID=A0A835W3X0_9CHLO|nr:hypothetical protein HYH02_010855 [Chlamydomonas schloesseri]|eukprot:KAG2438400.1 hypothetical protein HYH02_010855 [Chlamydomonas schloesseri]
MKPSAGLAGFSAIQSGPLGTSGMVAWAGSPLRASARSVDSLATRAVKEERKTTSGRKGDGGGGSPASTTSGRKSSASTTPAGSPPGTSSTRPPPPPRWPHQTLDKQQQQQARRTAAGAKGGAAAGGPGGGGAKGGGGSQLGDLMRRSPLLSRFSDGTLLLGDCVMILATEASSERIEWASFPALVGVLLGTWVAAGAWNGDYSPDGTRAHQDVPWQLAMLGPTYGAVLGAALTWSLAATASVAAYAGLVAGGLLDPVPVVEDINSEDMSPQLEVIVALLITMTCWRGIASKLRPHPPSS